MEKISNNENLNNLEKVSKTGIDLTKIQYTQNSKEINSHKHDIKYPTIGQNSQIKESIICIRPSHKSGLPVVKAEFKNKKYISHDYCHSGIGYSIMFGTVNQSIENLLELKKDLLTNKNQEITVIGLGCIGLYTALKLYSIGFKNIKLVGEKFNETPSLNAGGLMDFSFTTYNDEKKDYMNKIFYETFIEFKKICEQKHEILSKGVKYVDYFTDEYKEDMGLSYVANKGLIPKIQKVLLEFDTNKNMKIPLFLIKTYHIITKDFMDNMIEKANEYKIPIEYKKISNFEEINSEIIFNCTGLGSKELNNDKDCYPTTGHGIVLNEKRYNNFDYIFRIQNLKNLGEEFQHVNGPLYFMPKITGFIGGTYIQNYNGDDKDVNDYEISKLIERAKFFFNDLKPLDKKNLFSAKAKF